MQTKLRSDAFLQQAMDTCGDAVYRLALCRLNSRADAEDVYQEVFLRLRRDDTDFRDTEYLKAIPNGDENDNLGNLPSVSPQSGG